jgi:hypothetical protein
MRAKVAAKAGTWILWALAVVAVPVALALAVTGIDILRTQSELTADDTRFRAAPMRQAGLWDVGRLPDDANERLLGLEDDVEYRKLMGLYLKVEPGIVDYQGFPELESQRAKAQFELTRRSRQEPDPLRRSRLLTLYGVMTLDFRTISDQERQKILEQAVSAFRGAITLDETNADAKTNLEAVLSVHGPVAVPANAPSQTRDDGNVSGAGSPGSGY